MDVARAELIRITTVTYGQLRAALEKVPDDRLDWSPADGVMCPRAQIIHACAADRGYANHIDGGSRPGLHGPQGAAASRGDLLAHLDETRHLTVQLISSLEPAALDDPVDIPWRQGAPTRFVLLHMLRHKHYHVGQLTLLNALLAAARA